MRGNEKARDTLYALSSPAISIITQMELVQGLRNKQKQIALHRFLDQLNVRVIPVSEMISQRALFLMEQWRLSHEMLIADALIAATTIEHGFTLLTANDKHYDLSRFSRSNASDPDWLHRTIPIYNYKQA